MQRLFHPQQLVAFAFEHLRDRDPGPAADHLGNLLLGDLAAQQLEMACAFGRLGIDQLFFQLRNPAMLQFGHARQVLGTASIFQFGPGPLQLFLDVGGALHRGFLGFPDLVEVSELALELDDVLLEVTEALLRRLVGLGLQCLALDLELDQAPLEPVHRLGLGVDLHADPAGRLVHQVDSLVRQLPIGNIALRQRRRGDQRRIGDVDPVMHLVAFLQASENRDRIFDRWFADQHLLEASLERGILFDVLPVFIQRGRADAVQLAAGQGRLEHIAGIHRAFSLAGTDHGVNLVDEQNDLPFLLLQIVDYRLQPFLELAAELCTRNQRTEIQRQYAFVFQALGHLAIDDALGQTLDDRGLADAGLANQHRIVLGSALQHLNGPANFLVPTDHRIESRLLGTLGQVHGVLLQRLATVLCVGVIDLLAAAQGLDRLLQPLLGQSGLVQQLGQRQPGLQHPQHEQLGGNVGVAALAGKFVGQVEHSAQIIRKIDLPGLTRDFGQVFQFLAELGA